MRIDNQQDINDRLQIIKYFSKQINETIPDDIPMVFHGNNNIGTIYEIIKSGGLKTPEEREVDFKSFATQIDVGNKHDISVPVEFAEPGIEKCMPYGAIFAFYPKKDEIDKVLEKYGTEVPGGVKSIDFKTENDRFVGIITTEENKKRIQEWLKESGIDFNKVFTHSEFIERCKEKFKNKEDIKEGISIDEVVKNAILQGTSTEDVVRSDMVEKENLQEKGVTGNDQCI